MYRPILFLLLMTTAGVLGGCPDSSLIHPCTCEDAKDTPSHVRCSGFSNLDDLQQVIDNSVDFRFPAFTIENSVFPYINSTWLAVKRVERLELVDSILIGLFQEPPTTTDTVTQITVNNTLVLRKLQWEDFKSFVKLESLYVSGTEVQELTKGFRENVSPALRELVLNHTKISTLEGGVFRGKSNLITIRITNSRLRVVKNSYFEDQKKTLSNLDFSYNPITSIPGDLLTGFERTYDPYNPWLFSPRFCFSLRGAKIKTFQRNFVITWYYFVYDLRDNPIVCDCKLSWVTSIGFWPERFLGTCDSPSNVKSKRITNLRREDFKAC